MKRTDYITLLDDVLGEFADKPGGVQLGNAGQKIEDEAIRDSVKAHLKGQGFIDRRYLHTEPDLYSLTVKGGLFLQAGGYRGEERRQKREKHWTVAKTVATVLYSLAVLAVAIWAVCVELG